MRVAYYAQPAYLESGLLLAAELSRHVEFHLLLETTPGGWQSGLFEARRRPLASGLILGDPVLRDALGPAVRACWRAAASFHLAVHNQPRSLHPNSWRVTRSVARFLSQLNPDVIHVDDQSLRLALALNDLPRRPMVLSIHDPEAHSGESDWRAELARWLMFRRVTRFVLHNHAQRAEFQRRYGLRARPVDVVPLGVHHVALQDALPVDARSGPTVLFFGRLSPYKGLELLYRAAPHVAERVADVRFIVAGKPVGGYRPPPPPPLPHGARVLVIDKYISNADAADLFRQATVVVCPYTDATQSAVVLTAYGHGKPVVATRVGGLPEYVRDGETGLLVPDDDPRALASALISVLTDERLRQHLAQGVERIASNELSWPTIGQQMLAVYRAALACS